jgi:hypothetical protein
MRMKTWAAVACAGLITGGAIIAQPPKAEPPKGDSKAAPTTPGAPAAPDAPKAGESLVTMLGEARTALGQVRDYSCTFTRQELRNGQVSAEQVAEM